MIASTVQTHQTFTQRALVAVGSSNTLLASYQTQLVPWMFLTAVTVLGCAEDLV